jgi:hypothetical protein
MFRHISLPPEKLILDPRNPRLFVDEADYICAEGDDYSAPWVQIELQRRLESEPQHKLKDLKHSIRTKGFEPFSDIYVRQYGSAFLVFEGNRRTASIKSLLQHDREKLSAEALRSLREIPVKVLECPEESVEETVQGILTTLHLNGALQWQPMQHAFQYYKMYLELLSKRRPGSASAFEVSNYYINKLSDQLGRQRKDVVPEVQVYCLYKQLRDSDYAIDGTMYSMLKELLGRRGLASEYFEFDYSTYTMSEAGMSYLHQICLCAERTISEPRQIRFLYLCHKHERWDLLEGLASHDLGLNEVRREVEMAADEDAFLGSLQKIERECAKLVPKSDYSAAERNVMGRIFKLLDTIRRSAAES